MQEHPLLFGSKPKNFSFFSLILMENCNFFLNKDGKIRDEEAEMPSQVLGNFSDSDRSYADDIIQRPTDSNGLV